MLCFMESTRTRVEFVTEPSANSKLLFIFHAFVVRLYLLWLGLHSTSNLARLTLAEPLRSEPKIPRWYVYVYIESVRISALSHLVWVIPSARMVRVCMGLDPRRYGLSRA